MISLLDSLEMNLYLVSTRLLFEDGAPSDVVQWSAPLVGRSDDEAISLFDGPLFEARKTGDFAPQRVTLYRAGSFTPLQYLKRDKDEDVNAVILPMVLSDLTAIKSVDIVPELPTAPVTDKEVSS